MKSQCPKCKGSNTTDFESDIYCNDCNNFFKNKKKLATITRVVCPYCHNDAELVDSKVIYGKSYGMMWLCRPCEAYVSTHKNSNNAPLGALANAELRSWRNKAHEVFDALWKSGKMSRSEAYSWLQNAMNLSKHKAHIGQFNVEQCKRLIDLCN